MGAGAELKVEFELGGNWLDVTPRVMTAQAMRGRQAVTDPQEPGRARFTFDDPDRAFDNLNNGTRSVFAGGTFDQADLLAGTAVRVSIKPDGGSFAVRWAGNIVDFECSTLSGNDDSPSCTVDAVGIEARLQQPLPYWLNDRIADRLQRAPQGCFVTFDTSNEGANTGFVEDFSGFNAHGQAYTNDSAGTEGRTLAAGGGLVFGSGATETVQLPLRDPNRNAGAGWVGFVAIELAAGSPSGDFEYWCLFSEGNDDSDTTPPLGHRDGLVVYLREFRKVGGVAATRDTNQMSIVSLAYINGSVKLSVSNIDAGTREEWIGKKRLVMAGRAPGNTQASVMVLDDDGTVNGGSFDAGQLGHNFYDVAGAPASVLEEPRVMRLGATWPFTLGTTIDPFVGTMRFAGFAYSPPYDDGEIVLDGVDTVPEFLETSLADRIDQYREAAGFPSASWAMSTSLDFPVNECVLNAGRPALEVIRELVAMVHGRIVQRAGVVTVEDWPAASARAATSQATYTDIGDADVDLAYQRGSAVISSGRAQVVNRTTVELADGWSSTAIDATSVATHGAYETNYRLPFVSRTQAQAFALHVNTRLSTQRTYVSQLTVMPKGLSQAAWWAEIEARDIGDQISVIRRPGGVGSVSIVPSVIEGESWAWSAADDLFEWTFYLTHRNYWAGTFDGTV